jgi:hypothetical protein
MSLQEFASLGATLSGVGVVLSMIYFSMEFRHNKSDSTSAAFRLRRTPVHAIWTPCQRPLESRRPSQALRTPGHSHSPPQGLRKPPNAPQYRGAKTGKNGDQAFSRAVLMRVLTPVWRSSGKAVAIPMLKAFAALDFGTRIQVASA